MGATKEMYARLLQLNKNIVGCDWPKVASDDDFISLAERCVDTYSIGADDVVSGCSMGGMVAAEIQKIAKCKKLILIGSCLSPQSVPLHGLAIFGSCLLNERLLALSANSFPYGMKIKSSLLSNPGFVKWSLRAFYNWKGCEVDRSNNCFAIHGRFDAVIPVWKVRPSKIINGGHLIALTHVAAVNKFINESVA